MNIARHLRTALSVCVISMLMAACSPASTAHPHAEDGDRYAPSPINRCINLGNALEAPNEGDWGYTISDAHIETIANAGFDTIRVPIAWHYHTGPGPDYTIDGNFLQRISEVVRSAERRGMNVIINVHHFNPLMEDAAGNEAKLYAMWEQISSYFEGASPLVMFEFLNEPYGDMTIERVDRANQRLLEIVRRTHPDRWVIIGGGNWGNLDGLVDSNPPYDPHAMVTYHSYEPFGFTHQGAFWADPVPPMGRAWGTPKDYRDMRREFERAARFRDKVGMPMLLGEFGVIRQVPIRQRVEWTRQMRKSSEAYGFGWCYWDFAGEFRAFETETDSWITAILSALTGP